MKIVLASNTQGKLAELRAMFAPLGCELVAQGELGIPEAAEPFHTFVENALAKARHAALLSGLPALADDAGLCVDAFGGLPGVDTAQKVMTTTCAPCWSKCMTWTTAALPWSAPWWPCVLRKTPSR